MNENLVFGIPAIDSRLNGITKRDLVGVYGPGSSGKSEVLLQIGVANAARGKVVYHFAPAAIGRVLLMKFGFSIAKQILAGGVTQLPNNLSFFEWMHGEHPDLVNSCKGEVIQKMVKDYSGFRMIEQEFEFGWKDFEQFVIATKDDADLYLVDDIESLSDSSSGLAAVVQKLKSLSREFRIPIVVSAETKSFASVADWSSGLNKRIFLNKGTCEHLGNGQMVVETEFEKLGGKTTRRCGMRELNFSDWKIEGVS